MCCSVPQGQMPMRTVCQWQPQVTWPNYTQQMFIPRSTNTNFTALMVPMTSSWRWERAPSKASVSCLTSSIPYSFLFQLIHSFIQYFLKLIVYYMNNTAKNQEHKSIHGCQYGREDRHRIHNYNCLVK